MEKKSEKPAKSSRIQAGPPDYKVVGGYFEAVGRRKTSIARVRLFADKGDSAHIDVNGKSYDLYFHTPGEKRIAKEALANLKLENNFKVTAKIKGGGIHSQSEALRHGISRALLKVDPDYRKILKPLGFLTRDPRAKERRKFGLKKARKAPQWAKR